MNTQTPSNLPRCYLLRLILPFSELFIIFDLTELSEWNPIESSISLLPFGSISGGFPSLFFRSSVTNYGPRCASKTLLLQAIHFTTIPFSSPAPNSSPSTSHFALLLFFFCFFSHQCRRRRRRGKSYLVFIRILVFFGEQLYNNQMEKRRVGQIKEEKESSFLLSQNEFHAYPRSLWDDRFRSEWGMSTISDFGENEKGEEWLMFFDQLWILEVFKNYCTFC